MSPFPSLRGALLSNDEAARVIVFEDIELQLRIGAYESERHAPQRVRVSAELLVVPAVPLGADHLGEVVDYDAIHRDIAALAGEPHVDLQETLAARARDTAPGLSDRKPYQAPRRVRSTRMPTLRQSGYTSTLRT